MEIPKTAKIKKKKKTTFWKEQFVQLYSQTVFLCFFKFCMFCWKHYKIGFQQKQRKQQTNNKFHKLKLVQVNVKNWSKHVAQHNWTSFFSYIFLLFLCVFQKSSSFCRENKILKNKKQKNTQKKLDQFLTYKKARIGPVFNFTAYIYTHIYIYIYPLTTTFNLINDACHLAPKGQCPKITGDDDEDDANDVMMSLVVTGPYKKLQIMTTSCSKLPGASVWLGYLEVYSLNVVVGLRCVCPQPLSLGHCIYQRCASEVWCVHQDIPGLFVMGRPLHIIIARS